MVPIALRTLAVFAFCFACSSLAEPPKCGEGEVFGTLERLTFQGFGVTENEVPVLGTLAIPGKQFKEMLSFKFTSAREYKPYEPEIKKRYCSVTISVKRNESKISEIKKLSVVATMRKDNLKYLPGTPHYQQYEMIIYLAIEDIIGDKILDNKINYTIQTIDDGTNYIELGQ